MFNNFIRPKLINYHHYTSIILLRLIVINSAINGHLFRLTYYYSLIIVVVFIFPQTLIRLILLNFKYIFCPL